MERGLSSVDQYIQELRRLLIGSLVVRSFPTHLVVGTFTCWIFYCSCRCFRAFLIQLVSQSSHRIPVVDAECLRSWIQSLRKWVSVFVSLGHILHTFSSSFLLYWFLHFPNGTLRQSLSATFCFSEILVTLTIFELFFSYLF